MELSPNEWMNLLREMSRRQREGMISYTNSRVIEIFREQFFRAEIEQDDEDI
jgi:uncharacterized membrane protein